MTAPAPAASPPFGPGEPALAPDPNPDAPVRYEVPMPRGLFDRLTGHDGAPRCRYDAATGRAEFVAEPGPGHEWRAADVGDLFSLLKHSSAGEPLAPRFLASRATRLLSDDGAFEPDESLFIDLPGPWDRDLREYDGYLDVRRGHPIPDLVVEIDRSARSSHKLAPYFRMGVREAWTFSRREGSRIWVPDPESESGLRAVDRSRVLPGLAREDLDELLAGRPYPEAVRRSQELARRIVRAVLARREAG